MTLVHLHDAVSLLHQHGAEQLVKEAAVEGHAGQAGRCLAQLLQDTGALVEGLCNGVGVRPVDGEEPLAVEDPQDAVILQEVWQL